MRKIHLLKFLDRSCGAILTRFLPGPGLTRGLAPAPQKVLVIRPGGIGDAVHLAPFINTLRSTYPQLQIDILAERRNAGAFHLIRGIGRVLCYDRPAELLQGLRTRYDAVIDTEQWHRLSAVVARLTRAPIKIGFATNERARLFTSAIPYRQDDYEALSFLHLLEPFGMVAEAVPAGKWLAVPDETRASVASLLPSASHLPLVVIFPGASIAEKRWAASRFRAVAEWCLAHRLQLVLIGGAAERADGEMIAAGLDVVNLIGRTTLSQTAAVIETAAIVVSGDSGILHLAAGLDRPTVALFGPSSTVKWAPVGGRHIAIAKCDCSPCSRFGYTPSCSQGVRCMHEIGVADVTGAIATLFEQAGGQDRA